MMILAAPLVGAEVEVSGDLMLWHRVTLTVAGPETSETAEPNPFRDYRLDVTFAQGEKRLIVPGFYAADGNAAESGAESGNAWRVYFTPDTTGEWTYRVSFRSGKDVAISDDAQAGTPLPPEGATGRFSIAPSDKSGRDHRAQGILRYVGQRYLQYAGSGEYHLKGGADSPENFLAYFEFDGTSGLPQSDRQLRRGEARPSNLHRYEPHRRDWRPGDPTWRGGRGKNITGALNYLASQGMNSVYFLTMNVGGDGRDVWPWIEPDVRARYDVSKLEQWEIVFSHMDRLGILLHVVTQETENDQLLDGGELGPERKLYYRELVARFGHHPAMVWNLGEENTNTDAQRKAFCEYIDRLDAYDHAIVAHSIPGKYDDIYRPLLGDEHFCGPSLQMGDMKKTHGETVKWVTRSAEAGRPWYVCLDEIGPANIGVKPDAVDPEHNDVRQHALWGNLMGGGGGCEWYFGYSLPHNDLNCEDWRSRERLWQQTRFAMEFFGQHLPFAEMRPADELIDTEAGYCFAKPGAVYAVYLPGGVTTELTLQEGRYSVRWYNPRRGGELQIGTIQHLEGPGRRRLGSPPAEVDRDWVVLVRRD
jgi:hypothetical protein